jgi:hypothetical protein
MSEGSLCLNDRAVRAATSVSTECRSAIDGQSMVCSRYISGMINTPRDIESDTI